LNWLFKMPTEQMPTEQMRDEQMRNEQMRDEQMRDEQMRDEQMHNEQMHNEQMHNEQMHNEQMRNEQMHNEQMQNEQMHNEQMRNEQMRNEQMRNEQMHNEQMHNEQMHNEQMLTDSASEQMLTDSEQMLTDPPVIFSHAKPMVAFDIETTGLDGALCQVTAACLYGFHMPTQNQNQTVTQPIQVIKTFVFKGEDQAEDLRKREEFMAALDTYDRLCTFNGIRFDIPFIQEAWRVPPARAEAWVRKTFDVFEACKLAFSRTFGLDRLLEVNGLEGKTGSGKKAIQMALDKQWDALGDYCMQDTRMTHIVSSLPSIELPLNMPWGQKIFLNHDCPTLFVLREAVK